ncbi:MAG: FAD-dependent monooxygenase [Planctomycetota bacterium]
MSAEAAPSADPQEQACPPGGRAAVGVDAVVVGGGPAGSVAGMRLAEAGWRVAILERAAFPRRKVCGEYLSGTNWRLLRELGIWEAFEASAGPPIERVALFQRSPAAVTAPLPRAGGERSAEAWGRALTRDRLDLLLIEEAARRGAQVVQPARCHTVERVATGRGGGLWRCEADAGGEAIAFETPIVVAAHGAWRRSSLPTLPPAAPATAGDLLGFKAHFAGARLAPDLMPLLSFPGGYGGMVTCQAGLVSLSCCVRRRVLDRLRAESKLPAGEAVLKHIKRNVPAAADVLSTAERHGDWLAAGPIRPGRRRLHRDGLLAVGNAGGECHSVVAEGISMAMQSGWIAADCLLEASHRRPVTAREAVHRAGDAYATRWSREFGGRLRASGLIAEWAMRPWLVRASAPAVRLFPGLLTLGARLAGKSRVTCLKEDRPS